jgi:hypothetical protein
MQRCIIKNGAAQAAPQHLAAARTSDPRAAIEAVNSARFRMGAELVQQIGE